MEQRRFGGTTETPFIKKISKGSGLVKNPTKYSLTLEGKIVVGNLFINSLRRGPLTGLEIREFTSCYNKSIYKAEINRLRKAKLISASFQEGDST